MELATAKAKKSLVFIKLMTDRPQVDDDFVVPDSLLDESLFLIDSSNPWYGDIRVYLQPSGLHFICPKIIVNVFTIKQSNNSFWVTPSTTMGLILLCVDSSPMRRLSVC